MILSDLKMVDLHNQVELSAQVLLEKGSEPPITIYYRYPLDYQQFISLSGDAFVAALLIPCMFTGERLLIEAPVSAKLLQASGQIQTIFRQLFPKSKLVDLQVRSQTIGPPLQAVTNVGVFFTGGVDSYYSLLKNMHQHPADQQTISHLLFIKGFETIHQNKTVYQEIIKMLNRVAEQVEKKLVVIESNLREFSDGRTRWDRHMFGAGLASAGLGIGPFFKTIKMPASFTPKDFVRCGSRYDLDPLWSNEITTFEYDGAELSRSEKILDWVARSDLARRTLRVCFKDFNCGGCEKCLRTMLSLHCAGVLKDCLTFKQKLDPAAVREMQLSAFSLLFARENLKLLQDRLPESAPFHKALQGSIRAYHWRRIKRALLGHS